MIDHLSIGLPEGFVPPDASVAPATCVAFTEGPAAAADGTVYFSDTYGNRIRKISPQGIVSTVAGTGKAGLRDGPALAAELNFPRGLVLWKKTLLVADFNNHVVRKIELK